MVNTIIESYPSVKREARQDGSGILNVAEAFYNTVQGENKSGFPSTFLRVQDCTLSCRWCDTKEVWRHGNPYSINELLEIFDSNGVIDKLKEGQHLVLTGGSPTRQQEGLVELIETMKSKYNFKPFIEIENESVLMPSDKMFEYIDLWNNSPKLSTSGMPTRIRYQPNVLKKLSQYNSYFKFVITKQEDWDEIQKDFLDTGLIKKDRIVLMPEGATRLELQQHYQMVIDMACKYTVQMCDRLHITIYDKKTGV